MTANSRVAQWGTSLAIRIPKPLAEELKLQEGTAVELSAQDGQLTIARKELDIEEMISRITPDNRHEEWDLGPPQGKEIYGNFPNDSGNS